MSDARYPDAVAESPIKPAVAGLRVADGAALDDAVPFAEALTPAGRVERSREGEAFFFLFSPAGSAATDLCYELRDIVRRTYWSASGSVTAALRRSASVANQHLFEHNLNAERSRRCYGGLACAVLRGRDLFLLQAGPVWACILQEEHLRCFPRGEKLAHIGIGPLADARLHHIFAALGDTLLLAPYELLRDAGEEGLRRALSLTDVNSVAVGLEQLGGSDFAALVARWESVVQTPAQRPLRRKRVEKPSLPPAGAVSRRDVGIQIRKEPDIADESVPMQQVRREKRRSDRERRRTLRKVRLDFGRKLRSGLHSLGDALSHVWHGLAAAGAGLLALGKWLLGAMGKMIRSTLPGSERAAHRRTYHHPPPKENRTLTMAIAVTIPIVILAVVLIAYREFAAESRLQGIIREAKEQIALAQAAGADSEAARAHWEQALEQVEAAATLQPEEPSIQALRDQTQQALDRFDRIERLTLTHLAGFGSVNPGRHLILHDQTLFVLDSKDDWVARVLLDDIEWENAEIEGEESSEQNRPPVLVHTGQAVGGEDIGPLVDATWVDAEEGRQSSALLVLGEGGQLISYDPAWRSESGAPQLSLLELSSPPPGEPVAVGSYRGRFYILDAAAGGVGQIWRYKPQGDAYPDQPERYFSDSPPESLGHALDMAIDGHIYVLYQDGRVMKFLGGEIQPFEIRGVPGDLAEVAGFAVDPHGDGTVYVADGGNDRIVVLSPDGHFQSQFRTDPPMTSLEALAVSQASSRLYVLAAGQVYAAPLP
jgi:hypothetical protein